MLPVQAQGAAVSDLHIGRRLVGSWTLDLKSRAERNVVLSGPGAQSLDPSLIDSPARGKLILVWALQR
jgi:hypothetical protein